MFNIFNLFKSNKNNGTQHQTWLEWATSVSNPKLVTAIEECYDRYYNQLPDQFKLLSDDEKKKIYLSTALSFDVCKEVDFEKLKSILDDGIAVTSGIILDSSILSQMAEFLLPNECCSREFLERNYTRRQQLDNFGRKR